MCLIQVAKGRTDLHARSFPGNLCLRHSQIFFQCHKPCGSPTTVGTCSTKWKFLLFCFYLGLHEWAFPLWQTQHTLYSVFLPLFHTALLSWMQNPDFPPGNTEQWVYTREGNLIPSSLACDWSRDGRVTQFCQWAVRKHLVGGASREVAAFLIKRYRLVSPSSLPLCFYCLLPSLLLPVTQTRQ